MVSLRVKHVNILHSQNEVLSWIKLVSVLTNQAVVALKSNQWLPTPTGCVYLNNSAHLLDALHSRAGLRLLAHDDSVELCYVALPRFREIGVLVRLRQLCFGLNPLLLLALSGGSARPLQSSQSVFLECESGLQETGSGFVRYHVDK